MLTKFHSYKNPYDNPAPEINHLDDATLIAVAMPAGANDLVAVVFPDGSQTTVSVNVIDRIPDPTSLINVNTAPIGNASAGTLHVCAVALL
jgi:hypothetical protein